VWCQGFFQFQLVYVKRSKSQLNVFQGQATIEQSQFPLPSRTLPYLTVLLHNLNVFNLILGQAVYSRSFGRKCVCSIA